MLSEEDKEWLEEYGQDVALFAQFELPVFLQEFELEGVDVNDVWSAVHFCNQFGWKGAPGLKGHTPIEIMQHLYRQSTLRGFLYVKNYLFQNFTYIGESFEHRTWLEYKTWIRRPEQPLSELAC